MMFLPSEIQSIRQDFPYLQLPHPSTGKAVVYLDHAATTQRPLPVLEAVEHFYRYENGSPHRSAHYLAQQATEHYEQGRERVARFIGAQSGEEIVFTRNASESLNLLAYSLAPTLSSGEEILISILEHHSNLVPWQIKAKERGAKLVYVYTNADGLLPEEDLLAAAHERTKVISLTGASNVLGTMPDLQNLLPKLRSKAPHAKIIVDAAQLIPHRKLDVKQLAADFVVFSAHKMLGPLGLGVLYGRKKALNQLQAFLYGGDMIEYVEEQESSFLDAPHRFEAGTQNVGAVVGLVAAMDYLENLGMEKVEAYEQHLLQYCEALTGDLHWLQRYGVKKGPRTAVFPFNVEAVHPHDVASILDAEGIAIRSGHHCTQPLHRYLGLAASCRASFAFYNTEEEVETFAHKLHEVRKVMGL